MNKNICLLFAAEQHMFRGFSQLLFLKNDTMRAERVNQNSTVLKLTIKLRKAEQSHTVNVIIK